MCANVLFHLSTNQCILLQPFLDDAKLLKCLYKYAFGQILWTFVYLFAKNMKGWSYKLEIWYVEQSDPAFKKTRK